MSKMLYCIRHGLSEHNINYLKYGSKTFYDPNYVDTRLVDEGFTQASNLSKTWTDLNKIELVIVSPLKRTLQTSMEIFKYRNIPMIALECCREFPMGMQTCNKRSPKNILSKDYNKVDFSDLKTNYDEMWYHLREETIEELNKRIDYLKEFIHNRPETHIALIGHGSFIGQLKDNHIRYLDNGEKELEHCKPYLLKL